MAGIRLRLSKKGPARFMSHLDMGRAVARSLKRAGIAVSLTEGYRPHYRLAFGPALAVGMESEAEFVDVAVPDGAGDRRGPAEPAQPVERAEPREPAGVVEALNAALPTGLACLAARGLVPGEPTVQSLVRFAEYVARPRAGSREAQPATGGQPRVKPALESTVRAFLESGGQGGVSEAQDGGRVCGRDVRPLVSSIRVTEEPALEMVLACGPSGAVRPSEVLEALVAVAAAEAAAAASGPAGDLDLRSLLADRGIGITRTRLLGPSGEIA